MHFGKQIFQDDRLHIIYATLKLFCLFLSFPIGLLTIMALICLLSKNHTYVNHDNCNHTVCIHE